MIWKTSPAWAAHRGTTMAGSRHHRTCCFDAGYLAARSPETLRDAVVEAAKAWVDIDEDEGPSIRLAAAVAALVESEKK